MGHIGHKTIRDRDLRMSSKTGPAVRFATDMHFPGMGLLADHHSGSGNQLIPDVKVMVGGHNAAVIWSPVAQMQPGLHNSPGFSLTATGL